MIRNALILLALLAALATAIYLAPMATTATLLLVLGIAGVLVIWLNVEAAKDERRRADEYERANREARARWREGAKGGGS